MAFCWVGEMALFTTNDVIPRWDRTFQVSHVAELITLSRVDFDDVLKIKPEWFVKVDEKRRRIWEKSDAPHGFGCPRCQSMDHDVKECKENLHSVEASTHWSKSIVADVSRLNIWDKYPAIKLAGQKGGNAAGRHIRRTTVLMSSAVSSVKSSMEPNHFRKKSLELAERVLNCTVTPDEFYVLVQEAYPEFVCFKVSDHVDAQLARSLCSMCSVVWLLNDDYYGFTQSQEENCRLKRSTWDSMRKLILGYVNFQCAEDIDMVFSFLLMQSLGNLKAWCAEFAGTITDPDAAVEFVVQETPNVIPTLKKNLENISGT